MAITAEQAAQLASTYQTGGGGLQSLINQMGVTQADVAQYFPGFDVGGAGLTLPTQTTPPIDYSSFGLGRGAQSQLEKLSNIISTGGALTASQESRLGNLSQKAGQDLASFFNYTPTSEKYRYTPTTTTVAPTYGTQGLSGDVITDFIEANLDRPELIAKKAQEFGISSGDIASATGYTPQEQADYFQAFKMLPTPSAYGYDLFPELGGSQEKKLEKLINLLALGQELTPGQAQQLTKLGAKTGYDFFNVPTYQSLEEQLGERAKGATFQNIVDYIGQNIDDPTKIYQRAAELGISPEDVLLAYSATQKKGKSPYSLEQIQEYFETGKGGYGTTFDSLLASTFGESNVASAKNLFNPEDFSSKSIESIQETLQNSTANKNQEALRLAGVLSNVYGYDAQQAVALARDIASGKVEDQGIMSVYNSLLKENALTEDLQTQLLQHIAKTNPDAKFFQDNPNYLEFYTPIEKSIASPKDSGQYGYYKNIPILNANEVENLLAGEVFQGRNNYFGYGGGSGRDDSLGWDLRSKYLGSITNGAGIFGVTATRDQINDFSRIQAEIDRLGGIQIGTDSEGNGLEGVYVDRFDEYGNVVKSFVPIQQFFATSLDPESGASDGSANYKLYQDTLSALNKGATELKLDTSELNTPTELFNAVQDQTKNLYVVTGRANNWDAAESEALGLTGHGKSRGGINHATVFYKKVGDKLVPMEDDAGNPIVKTFNFDDPETSKGFFGDLFRDVMSIVSIPPIALALSAATGGISNIFSGLTQPVVSTLVSAGVNELAANAVTNAVLSSILSEATGGDAGDAFLSTLISSGIGGTKGLPGLGEQFLNQIGFNNLGIAELVDPRTLGRFAGTYAGSAITGTDPTKMLINQAITQGIRSLPGVSKLDSSFADELKGGGEGFQLSEAEKAKLSEELASLGNDRVPGILGLPLATEKDILAAVNQIVPLLTAKGLTKQEATLLASNIIGAARSA